MSEVTWPGFHQEFEKHNLTVFWKQKVVPKIELLWPTEALAYVDWQMAVDADYYVMMPRRTSSFDAYALIQRRMKNAPTFNFHAEDEEKHVECN